MKVIDCFPFFDELDLLEIRLNELKDVVDVTVITESDKTYSGLSKPLYFKENEKRFNQFNIVYAGPYTDNLDLIPIDRECRQKQFNIDYAYEKVFTPGDVMLLGDCDEIPRSEVVKDIIKDDSWSSVRLVMDLYYYYLNCREVVDKKRVYRNTRALRPSSSIKYNKNQRDETDITLWGAGWHFSYMGDIKSKLESWGHADMYNKPPYNTKEHIENCKINGLDLIMRKGSRRLKFEFLDELDHLPRYVVDNIDRFKKYFHENE